VLISLESQDQEFYSEDVQTEIKGFLQKYLGGRKQEQKMANLKVI